MTSRLFYSSTATVSLSGTAIDMMDACIADMDGDKVERAVIILKEIFSGNR